MRIEHSPRVVYANNPLAEVVCQLRMAPLDELGESLRAQLQSELSTLGYVNVSEEVSLALNSLTQLGEGPAPSTVTVPQFTIVHFTSQDGIWRVSVCREFVALTSLKYSVWEEFSARLRAASKVFLRLIPQAQPVRLGLRYKDVIEREPLGLQDVPWHELVKPFLLGPLAPDALADGQTPDEAEFSQLLGQALFNLSDCKVLLLSSLLTSVDGERRAFLIDADFFVDNGLDPKLFADEERLTTQLKVLHLHAGALFRRCITTRLNDALSPAS